MRVVIRGKYGAAQERITGIGTDGVESIYLAGQDTRQRTFEIEAVNIGQCDAAGLVDFRVVGDDAHVEVVFRLIDGQLQTRAHAVAVVIQVIAQGQVFDIPIALCTENSAAERDRVAERDIHGGADLRQAVVADREVDKGVSVLARANRAYRDRAGSRVLAEQRTLRATQDFDGLDIDQVIDHRALARTINAVDIQADGRFDAEVVGRAADTANGEVRGRRSLAPAHQQARHILLQIPDILDTGLFDLSAGNGGDRDRDLHDVLRTPLRHDDNFFEEKIFVVLLSAD